MFVKNILRLFMMVCALALISACVNSNSTPEELGFSDIAQSKEANSQGGDLQLVGNLPPPMNTNNGVDLLISENDVLEVDVFQVDDLDKEVRVGSNGRISLPLIGSIPAAGKTIPQLENDIERRYGTNYLQNPEVSIFMKESAGQRITLDGEFAKPGVYQSDTSTTLLKATALASGLTPLADEKKLYVFREIGSQKYVAQYSIKEIRGGLKPNPRIYGGDVIIAFRSDSKVARQNLREALGIAVSATSLARPF